MIKSKQIELVLNLKYQRIAGKYKNNCKNIIFNLPQKNLESLFNIVTIIN